MTLQHHSPVASSTRRPRRLRRPSSTNASLVTQLTRGLTLTYTSLHAPPRPASHMSSTTIRVDETPMSSATERRVLTKKTKPSGNNGLDNEEQNLIVRVRDVLGGGDALPIQPEFIVLDMLGQGTFGQVFRCQNVDTKELVAIKVIRNHPSYYKQAIVEVQITRMLNASYTEDEAPHFVRMKDTFEYRNHLCIVFELLSINVYELIAENNFNGFPLEVTRGFQQQILHALVRMDEIGVIHCDLKPENILLVGQDHFLSDVVYTHDPQMARLVGTNDAATDSAARTPYIKVVDFGSACMENETVYSYIQSRFYRSPEVLLGIPYTGSIDLWSLGCIAVEMVLGLPLFPGVSEHDQLRLIEDTLGPLPQELLRKGRNVLKFYNVTSDNRFVLKTPTEFARDTNAEVQVSKKYFKYTKLEDMIHAYPYAKHTTEAERCRERERRNAFLHFVRGLLCVDPLQRWSARVAMRHPFITGTSFADEDPQPIVSKTAASVSSVVAPHRLDYARSTSQAWPSPVPPVSDVGELSATYNDSQWGVPLAVLGPSSDYYDPYEDDHLTPTTEYYGTHHHPPPSQQYAGEKPNPKVTPAYSDVQSNRVYPYYPYNDEGLVQKAYEDSIAYSPSSAYATSQRRVTPTHSSDPYPILPMSPYECGPPEYNNGMSYYASQPIVGSGGTEWPETSYDLPCDGRRDDYLPPQTAETWSVPRHHQYQPEHQPQRRGKRQHTNSWDCGDVREVRRHEPAHPQSDPGRRTGYAAPASYAVSSHRSSGGHSSTSGRIHTNPSRKNEHKSRNGGGSARHHRKSMGANSSTKPQSQHHQPQYPFAPPSIESQYYYTPDKGIRDDAEVLVYRRQKPPSKPYSSTSTRDEPTAVCSVEEKFSSVMSLDRQNSIVPMPT